MWSPMLPFFCTDYSKLYSEMYWVLVVSDINKLQCNFKPQKCTNCVKVIHTFNHVYTRPQATRLFNYVYTLLSVTSSRHNYVTVNTAAYVCLKKTLCRCLDALSE